MDLLYDVFLFKASSLLIVVDYLRSDHPIPVYVEVGDSVTLNCSVDNTRLANWEGPCPGSDECLTTYYNDLTKAPDLSPTFSLHLSSGNNKRYVPYDLHIFKVSSKTVGTYRCNGIRGGTPVHTTYIVICKENQSIYIRNMTRDGRIHGAQNESLELFCEVSRYVTVLSMTWYKNHTVVKAGVSRELNYTFVPTHEDHKTTVTCRVIFTALDKPLEKAVTLDIKYAPVVHFANFNKPLIEGHDYVLECLADSNPPASLTYITKEGHSSVQTISDSSKCSMMLHGSRNNNGKYSCTAQNIVGSGKTFTTVLVAYSPDVTINKVNYTLLCKAKGEPMKTSFVAWKHYSDQGQLMESFNGSDNLVLKSSNCRYMLNGLYVCKATNGIPDTAGNLIQSGKYSVTILGIPEVLPKTKLTQYVKFKRFTLVTILVYSIPAITKTTIVKNGIAIAKKILSDATVDDDNNPISVEYKDIKENIFGKEVSLKGYNISLRLTILDRTYFTNYTFLLENEEGSESCVISLKEKEESAPLVPTIRGISVTESDIKNIFKRNNNGGLPQQFVLEYKTSYAQHWTFAAIINDTMEDFLSYTIHKLASDKEYCIQVYSRNSVGNSSSSKMCSIKILANKQELYLPILFVVCSLTIIVCTTIVFRLRRQIQSWLVRKFCFRDDSVGNVQGQIHEVVATAEIYGYQSNNIFPTTPQRRERLNEGVSENQIHQSHETVTMESLRQGIRFISPNEQSVDENQRILVRLSPAVKYMGKRELFTPISIIQLLDHLHYRQILKMKISVTKMIMMTL